MNLILLGSAAAEGFPGLFCDCEHCRAARAAGGRNLRLRAAALVNDDLLLDFGPDLVAASQRHGLSLAKVRAALITHFHDDHWQPDNVLYHHPWFRAQSAPTLHLYGGTRLEEDVAALCRQHGQSREEFAVEVHVVRPFERFRVGEYEVRSFAASHSEYTEPMIYAVAQDDQRLLYATDTGPLPEETWEALRGLQAHLLMMEMTMGPESHRHHLGRADFLATLARMKKEAVLAPEAKVVAFHFAHHFTPLHEQLEKELAEYGIIAGYDGLRVEI